MKDDDKTLFDDPTLHAGQPHPTPRAPERQAAENDSPPADATAGERCKREDATPAGATKANNAANFPAGAGGSAAETSADTPHVIDVTEHVNSTTSAASATTTGLTTETGRATKPVPSTGTVGSNERTQRTIASSLWAAWADSLGFITELTSASGLRRRLGGKPLHEPVAWTRRVGGRTGPDKLLPAGTYSDDTQLRLAVARCLSPSGFDTNAFAHVELPGWLVYALGGGLSTRSAANSLMRPNAAWYATQHDGWINSGGNGAAMRIQPHVWAAPDPTAGGPWLSALISDACTTHAHPRALVGAAIHAYALGAVITTGKTLGPTYWPDLLEAASHDALTALREHPELSEYWLPAYDAAAREAGAPSLAQAWSNTVEEVREQLTHAASASQRIAGQHNSSAPTLAAQDAYRQLVKQLRLDDPSRRGSGTATVIAALTLGHAYSDRPDIAGRLAASDVTTDTDTIATMAGAISGAAVATLPEQLDAEQDFSDRAYIVHEGKRLSAIADGRKPPPVIRYPDLLTWNPPKAQVDLVGLAKGQPALAGLSVLTAAEDKPTVRDKFQWQWYLTEWGQHVLIRSRLKLRPLPTYLLPVTANPAAPHNDIRGARQDAAAAECSENQADMGIDSGLNPDPIRRGDPRNSKRAGRQSVLGGDLPQTNADADGDSHAGDDLLEQPGVETATESSVAEREPRPRAYDGPLTDDDLRTMVRWVVGRGFTDADIGYAVRRVGVAASPAEFRAFTEYLYGALSRRVHKET